VNVVDVDVAVVGGGIAGVSVAAELSREQGLRVVLLERENQLGYHASGRSAAAFLESYGSPEIRALTRASRSVLEEGGLLAPRPFLWLAPEDQVGKLRKLLDAEATLRECSEAEVRALCPAVRPGWSVLNAVEAGAQDLDVAGLLELYRRLAVTNGVTIHTGASILDGRRKGDKWHLHTTAMDIRTGSVINGAGAWADDVAQRCGQASVGLTPYRRTVAIVTSAEVDRAWPLVGDIGETFYFRPEGDGLLLSPADEHASEPVDARAEMEDVALALERANEATTLNLRHVRTTWAGLRTFAPDRNPVVGAAADGFHWLAGQGGYGMQTAPAMASLAASMVLGHSLPDDLASEGFDPARLSPARFASTA
jgi:D-arginine dehydrogenase